MNSKKAIILLHAQHEPNIEQLQESLLSYCRDNNFTIIKTIIDNEITDDEYDCQALSRLINLIKSQKGSINLIVTNNSFNDPFHIFTYTVIATLLEAKLINRLYIYQGETSQTTNTSKPVNHKLDATNGEKLLEVKKSLLPLWAAYYKTIITINKIKTYYDDE